MSRVQHAKHEYHTVPGRPDVAIKVTRTIDHSYTWDGDGPNPVDDGYDPYDVRVRAYAIREGRLYTGTDYLGGSYFRLDEPTGDVHGYLPQMIDEAVADLDRAMA